MRLIDYQHRIAAQVGLRQELAQQHAVCHVLDEGLGTGAVLETNGISDLRALN